MYHAKFRQPVFNISNNFSHWHYWGKIYSGKDNKHFIPPNDIGRSLVFAGSLDKNLKEIYEADIVRIYDSGGHDCGLGIVSFGIYEDSNEYSSQTEHIGFHINYNSFMRGMNHNYVEVIGNTYEHPDLFDKEKDEINNYSIQINKVD